MKILSNITSTWSLGLKSGEMRSNLDFWLMNTQFLVNKYPWAKFNLRVREDQWLVTIAFANPTSHSRKVTPPPSLHVPGILTRSLREKSHCPKNSLRRCKANSAFAKAWCTSVITAAISAKRAENSTEPPRTPWKHSNKYVNFTRTRSSSQNINIISKIKNLPSKDSKVHILNFQL